MLVNDEQSTNQNASASGVQADASSGGFDFGKTMSDAWNALGEGFDDFSRDPVRTIRGWFDPEDAKARQREKELQEQVAPYFYENILLPSIARQKALKEQQEAYENGLDTDYDTIGEAYIDSSKHLEDLRKEYGDFLDAPQEAQDEMIRYTMAQRASSEALKEHGPRTKVDDLSETQEGWNMEYAGYGSLGVPSSPQFVSSSGMTFDEYMSGRAESGQETPAAVSKGERRFGRGSAFNSQIDTSAVEQNQANIQMDGPQVSV